MSNLLSYIPFALQTLLFLIMFGMGMTLTVSDFKRVVEFPKAMAIGLGNQVILLPLIGLAIVTMLSLSPVIAMGIMLVSVCPGGATSNLISHLSKGDTALSITLTAFSSLITIFTIPFIINFSLVEIMGSEGKAIQLSIIDTIFSILKLTAFPVALGMFIKYLFPLFAEKSRKPLTWSSGIFILIALALLVLKLSDLGSVWPLVKAAGLATVVLNLSTLGLGFVSSKIMKLQTPQAISISIETGMQNNVLGMAIASSPSLLNNAQMGVVAGVYGIVMCLTGLLLIFFFRKLVSDDD